MPVLEIITIGTELLLGEISDTNSTYIARTLRDHGIDIYRITTIGDNPSRISAAIKEACERADIIITTGGLGPTVDDPTRQSVADAVNRELVYLPELWDQIVERFKGFGRQPTENNRRQAYIPAGAIPIKNPVGSAPCFIVEHNNRVIIPLPGVPVEMQYLLHQEIIPFLIDRFSLETQIIKATVLHVAAMGESVVDEIIADLESSTNPTVGLLAHPGQVDIRITAKAGSEEEANQLMTPIIDDLYNRLGTHIYGRDGDTLGGVIASLLSENNLKLQLILYGMDGTIKEMLAPAQSLITVLDHEKNQTQDLPALTAEVSAKVHNHPALVGIGVSLLIKERNTLYLAYQDPSRQASDTRFYGAPNEHAQLWAARVALDFLRRNLVEFTDYTERGPT